jgi:hypothetical protein
MAQQRTFQTLRLPVRTDPFHPAAKFSPSSQAEISNSYLTPKKKNASPLHFFSSSCKLWLPLLLNLTVGAVRITNAKSKEIWQQKKEEKV